MRELILGSTSTYRIELMTRLHIPFIAKAPLFDEELEKQHHTGSPQSLAESLALGKAKSLFNSNNCVIGADQIVSFEGRVFGKAGDKTAAYQQLKELQGKSHQLITAVSIVHSGKILSFTNLTRVKLRALTTGEIETYLALEQPFDCAGSYKIEKLGISIMEKIESEDWTAIQGLPLIQLSQGLRQFGYSATY